MSESEIVPLRKQTSGQPQDQDSVNLKTRTDKLTLPLVFAPGTIKDGMSYDNVVSISAEITFVLEGFADSFKLSRKIYVVSRFRHGLLLLIIATAIKMEASPFLVQFYVK